MSDPQSIIVLPKMAITRNNWNPVRTLVIVDGIHIGTFEGGSIESNLYEFLMGAGFTPKSEHVSSYKLFEWARQHGIIIYIAEIVVITQKELKTYKVGLNTYKDGWEKMMQATREIARNAIKMETL